MQLFKILLDWGQLEGLSVHLGACWGPLCHRYRRRRPGRAGGRYIPEDRQEMCRHAAAISGHTGIHQATGSGGVCDSRRRVRDSRRRVRDGRVRGHGDTRGLRLPDTRSRPEPGWPDDAPTR